jgi:uroporphyrinogen III methyltransferase/synthase
MLFITARRSTTKRIDGVTVLPLTGKRFLITRSVHQASTFVHLLEEQGGEAICIPTIEIVPPHCWRDLDRAIEALDSFDILILTSANGVTALFERLGSSAQMLSLVKQKLLVAVGPKTAEALTQRGLEVDCVSTDYRAEGIVKLLHEQGVAGRKILYPRAEIARPLLLEELRRAGADVVAPVAYRTLMPQQNSAQIRACLERGDLAAVCFTSSSTFVNLHKMLGDDLRALKQGAGFFSIGPQTSKTIRDYGYEVDLEPRSWTVAALVSAMVEYYK